MFDFVTQAVDHRGVLDKHGEVGMEHFILGLDVEAAYVDVEVVGDELCEFLDRTIT